jgi:hypothetical protein
MLGYLSLVLFLRNNKLLHSSLQLLILLLQLCNPVFEVLHISGVLVLLAVDDSIQSFNFLLINPQLIGNLG